MKLIFLDIDGVLNNEQWYSSGKAQIAYLLTGENDIKAYNFDPDNWKWIEKLIQDTDAKIVLSSSWRSFSLEKTIEDFTGTAFELLVKYMVGVTPYSFERHRGKEIQHYLDNCTEQIESYVIFDDDTDMLENQRDNFVHTDFFNGVTEKDYIKAKEILNE